MFSTAIAGAMVVLKPVLLVLGFVVLMRVVAAIVKARRV